MKTFVRAVIKVFNFSSFAFSMLSLVLRFCKSFSFPCFGVNDICVCLIYTVPSSEALSEGSCDLMMKLWRSELCAWLV